MKELRWYNIFELEKGDALSEEGYQITVFKPDTTIFEMICAWLDYTKKCHTKHVRVLLIDDSVFPSDYIYYDIVDSCLIPKNIHSIPDNNITWQELLGKRVAKCGCFFRIPEDRNFFDLYLRLEEDELKKPFMIVKANALLHPQQLQDAVDQMNEQISTGYVVRIPSFFDLISFNFDGSGIEVHQERKVFSDGKH